MFAFAKTIKISTKIVVIATLGVAVAGCTATNRKHGWVPSDELLSEVVVGVDTRESVSETLGEPTAAGVVRDGGYYYISSVVREIGARAPKVVSRDLVAVTFDTRDVVSGVEHYALADGRVVPLERRVTSSTLEDKTFLRQLLGNLGNFDPSSLIN